MRLPSFELSPRQEWVVIGVGWAWLVAEFVAAAAVIYRFSRSP